MKIIATANQKGGTGKTTILTNIGRILALTGKRVLMIDTDSQTNLSTNLQINADEQILTFADILLNNVNETNIEQLCLKTDLNNLDLIASSVLLEEVEQQLVIESAREFRFMRFLSKNYEYFNKKYDYILIDTKPQKSIINANVFLVADEILLVTDVDVNSVNGLKIIKDWWAVKTSTDQLDQPNTAMNYIIINNVEEQTNMFKDITNFFQSNADMLNLKIMNTFISKSIRVKEATAAGKSIVEFDSKHKVAEQYVQLIKQMYQLNILKGGK